MFLLRSFARGSLFGEVRPGGRNDELWVFLHGWGRSSADFDGLFSLAAKTDNGPWLARFDMPGFGSSPLPSSPVGTSSYAEMINDAVEVIVGEISAIGQGESPLKVIVMGHSFGGRVALTMAVDRGKCSWLSGLVLSGVPLLRLPEVVRKTRLPYRILRFMSRYGVIPKARMDRYREKYGSADYKNAKGIMRDIFVRVVNEDYSELVRTLEVPTVFLWGENDSAAPVAVAARAQSMNADLVSLSVHPGDHFLAVRDPGLTLAVMAGLSKRIGDG